MPLIDEAHIRVFGGNGGNGCRSFRREKYIPFGGPNGGNGGNGGSVYLVATHDKGSLLDFKYQPKYQAKRGEHGMGKDMFGRAGEDLFISIPVGTQVYDEETQELIADLVHDAETLLVAKGGRGGLGNLAFKTSTNRAPRKTTPGALGESRELKLELKLIADIGLVGLPNAGKSSLLRAVSRAQPRVADYPFTTLEPNLGVCEHKGHQIVIADLPGLIEGAAEGAGLGHKFLKHVSRNRVLLHLVDVSRELDEIEQGISVIRNELLRYDATLLAREQLLVFTKCDLFPVEEITTRKQDLKKAGLTGFFVSSQTGFGMEALLDELSSRGAQWRREEPLALDQVH